MPCGGRCWWRARDSPVSKIAKSRVQALPGLFSGDRKERKSGGDIQTTAEAVSGRSYGRAPQCSHMIFIEKQLTWCELLNQDSDEAAALQTIFGLQ